MPHFLNERTVITIVDDISQAVSTYLIDSVFNVSTQGPSGPWTSNNSTCMPAMILQLSSPVRMHSTLLPQLA